MTRPRAVEPLELRRLLAAHFAGWSAPVNLGPAINTSVTEAGPAISKDGLSLYFSSTRQGGLGSFDLWVSERASEDAPWGAPANLGPVINTPDFEDAPAFSRDGHWMFFLGNRPEGLGAADIYASWRPNTHDNFGWQAPVNLGPGVNSAFADSGPTYFDNDDAGGAPRLYFSSNRPGGPGGFDIYASEQSLDGSFGAAVLVPELSSAGQDVRPSIRHDGLEMFLSRGATGSEDLWVSTRASLADPWSEPVGVGPVVNSPARDFQPYIFSDRGSLYFVSNRPGGAGAADLYVATRSKANQGNATDVVAPQAADVDALAAPDDANDELLGLSAELL